MSAVSALGVHFRISDSGCRSIWLLPGHLLMVVKHLGLSLDSELLSWEWVAPVRVFKALVVGLANATCSACKYQGISTEVSTDAMMNHWK